MDEKPPVRFLTPKQVAERYGLTVKWVYGCHALQAIAIRCGKYLRYRESDLVEKFETTRSSRRGYQIIMRRIGLEAERRKAEAKRPKFKLKFDIADTDERVN